jgi:cyclopropane-fatty-acyl-phospholipid synthase
MNGLWDCDNLTAVIRIFARNRHLLDSIDGRLGKVGAPLYRLLYALRRNTRSGSRRNIHRHYDLGNEFFQLFLDETLTYSSAYFESEAMSLRDASLAKIDRLCDKLELSTDDHLLEIGTGWGGFAIRAAQRHGCRVTTATISREQYNLARERVENAGLSDRITVLLKDYRDLEGTFDKLVSVEMIEAVGYPFLEDYFRKCDALLRPGGRMVLQAITIADEFLEPAMRSVDFIKHYIFPGSALPSLNLMRSIVERATRFRWSEVEDITSHYVLTLRLWRERFHEAIERVRSMGYSEEFIRMWDYYFCYCEGGFSERHIGDVQLTLDKSSGEEP